MSKGAFVPCKGVSDLRAHQNDLRGIIDPYQDDDDRGCGSVCGLQALLAYVKSNDGFPEFKKRSSSHRSKPDVVPVNSRVREPLEHHRKQQRSNADGSQDGDYVKKPLLHMQGYRMFKSMSTRKLSSQAARLSLPRNEVFVSG